MIRRSGSGEAPTRKRLDQQDFRTTKVLAADTSSTGIRSEGQNRTVVIEEGGRSSDKSSGPEPWFVLADVCKVLEIGTTAAAKRRLHEDDKGMTTIHTLGGNQKVGIVNESGLYDVGSPRPPGCGLILDSRKPAPHGRASGA